MICDRCGNDTKEKWITSKKTGKQHKMFECTSGCKEGQWAYSFFPPRDSSHAQAPRQAQQPQNNDVIERLKVIDKKLTQLIGSMQPGDKQNFTHDEMKPDEDVPF